MLRVIMLSVIMPSVIMLSDIMLSVILLSVIMLSVILLSVIMLSVILLSAITLNVIIHYALALTHSIFTKKASLDWSRVQCYVTFYSRNLRIFIISYSVCPRQASPA